MKLKIAQFVSLVLLVLVVGVFWGTWFALARSISTLSADVYLLIGKTIISNVAPVMPILMPLALASTLVVLALMPNKRSRAFYLALLGSLLLVVTLLITLLVEVPIDNQTKQWTPATLPRDWQQIRDTWEFYHTIRTFTSLASFVLILAATLYDVDRGMSGHRTS